MRLTSSPSIVAVATQALTLEYTLITLQKNLTNHSKVGQPPSMVKYTEDGLVLTLDSDDEEVRMIG